MSYPYILYAETPNGPKPKVQFNLSASSIQGIYSAQILVLGMPQYYSKTGFSLISGNSIPSLRSGTKYEEAFLYPLNNLLDYGNMIMVDNGLYHSVIIDETGNIQQSDTDPFTHIIRYYKSDDTLSEVGIKITSVNPQEFIDGFLKYFELLYQYQSVGHLRMLYSFDIQQYQYVSNTRNYVKVGEPVFRSSLNGWLFTSLYPELQIDIMEYIPKTFAPVSKAHNTIAKPYILKYCKGSDYNIYKELLRRIKARYIPERIMEIYKSSIIANSNFMTTIMDIGFEANYPEILIRIINTLKLNAPPQSGIISYYSIGDIITISLLGQPGERIDMVNKILKIIIPRLDYNPPDRFIKRILMSANKEIAKLLIEHNKLNINSLTYADIEYNMSEDSLEVLVESTEYNPAINDYILVTGIVDRISGVGLNLSILQKLLDRPDFDPSFDNNRLLKRILNEGGIVEETVDLVLNNDKVDIYRGGYDLLPLLAQRYPEKLIAKLQKDGTINDTEMMNQYVYPYIQQG